HQRDIVTATTRRYWILSRSLAPYSGEEAIGPFDVRQRAPLRHPLELGVRAIESICYVLVLGVADRAGAVHEPLRGQRGGGLQELALERRQLRERARIDAPARVRSAPQHAQLGAGRIDQDEVGRARTIDDFDLPLCACASRAGPQALEALAVDV